MEKPTTKQILDFEKEWKEYISEIYRVMIPFNGEAHEGVEMLKQLELIKMDFIGIIDRVIEPYITAKTISAPYNLKRYSNHNKNWSQEDIRKLWQMKITGKSLEEMSIVLLRKKSGIKAELYKISEGLVKVKGE